MRSVTVANPHGLHARPADLVTKLASRFESRIFLVKGSERADARNIWALLTLAAVEGTELLIEADGPDAQPAADALAEMLARPFPDE